MVVGDVSTLASDKGDKNVSVTDPGASSSRELRWTENLRPSTVSDRRLRTRPAWISFFWLLYLFNPTECAGPHNG